MPHLSPMNWIISIISFWFLALIISSNFWWSQNSKFLSNKSSKIHTSKSSWKWQ